LTLYKSRFSSIVSEENVESDRTEHQYVSAVQVMSFSFVSRSVTSNLSKAHETRDSLAVPVRRFSWSISIHFVATQSWNLRRSRKLQKN